MYWRGDSWQHYETGVVDDKVQDMTAWVGSECRVEDTIIGSEKLVYYIHHSVTEDSQRVGDSEPEAMALMDGGE